MSSLLKLLPADRAIKVVLVEVVPEALHAVQELTQILPHHYHFFLLLLSLFRISLFVQIGQDSIFGFLEQLFDEVGDTVLLCDLREVGNGLILRRFIGQTLEDQELLSPLVQGDFKLLLDNLTLCGVHEEVVGHALRLLGSDEREQFKVRLPAHVSTVLIPFAAVH